MLLVGALCRDMKEVNLMSFKGKSEEKLIKTSFGKTFKMFITEQESGHWVATVLFVNDDGEIAARNVIDVDKIKVYTKALNVFKPVGTACSRHKEKLLPALKKPKDHLRCCQGPYSIRPTSRKCPMCTRPRRQ